MRIKELNEKYKSVVSIRKTNSTYGNYIVEFKHIKDGYSMGNYKEYFFKLSPIEKFIESHLRDLRNGNSL